MSKPEIHDSTVVSREACPQCRSDGGDKSGDNLAIYSDDHKHCFACGYHSNGSGVMLAMNPPKVARDFEPLRIHYEDLPERKLPADILRRFQYGMSTWSGRECQVSSFYNADVLVAQHLRFPPDENGKKKFLWNGSYARCELFGQRLWKAGGKALIITEGEIDCMTVDMVLGSKWPVVSLPNGTESAVRDIKRNLEFVSSFDEVILMFDMDKPGRDAAKAVAEVLPPGRCRIAVLPHKDANDCLLKNESAAIIAARWQAAIYSPDEILHASAIIAAAKDSKPKRVWCYPYPSLNTFLVGRRSGEIVMWGSGTKSGKSTVVRELIAHDLQEGRKVGAIMLEESPEETIDDLASLIISKPIRILNAWKMMNQLREHMGQPPIECDILTDTTDDEILAAKARLSESGLYLYDHMGNTAMKNLMARMEYMAVSLGVDVIVLDHITAAAAGVAASNLSSDSGDGNERLVIDGMMKDLRSLAVRTGVHIDIVSQLKKSNKSFEEGDRITLQDFRGSGSLGSVPNCVIALERDRQSTDKIKRNTTEIRVLADRLTGRSGVAGCLLYDPTTFRLKDVEFCVDDNGHVQVAPTTGFDPVDDIPKEDHGSHIDL